MWNTTNHWSTKKRGKLSKQNKKQWEEASTFTARQAEKYQALVEVTFNLVTHPQLVPHKGMDSQDPSNYTLNAC